MRALIVEDQTEMRQAIGRRLRSEGHGADEACDGGEAESFLATYGYDVLVLDRMLPDGEGLELLQRWRAQGTTTPALILTARDLVEDRVAGFAAGADDYLIKPFAMDELMARLTAIARRGSSTRPNRLTLGDLEIDVARRQVRRAGILLTLRPKEFAVLQLLVTRAGRAVTRRDIITGCWGEDHEPLSNVEEVVVGELRRKLGSPSLIRTVRGVGYLADDPEGTADGSPDG